MRSVGALVLILLVAVASAEEPLRLEGIMNMGGKRVALINGSIYEEGQAVEGMTVIKVTETNVTVQANGIERVLKIHR